MFKKHHSKERLVMLPHGVFEESQIHGDTHSEGNLRPTIIEPESYIR